MPTGESNNTNNNDSETSENLLYHYCLDKECWFTETWNGGSAADDPSLPHLFQYPEHVVRSGATDGHKRSYELQKSGEKDITWRNDEATDDL